MAEAARGETEKDAATGTPEAGAAVPVAKSKLRRLLPYALFGLVSAGLGVTAAIVTQPKPAGPTGDPDHPTPPPTPYDKFAEPFDVALPEIITNLADPSESVSGRFLIHLEVRTLPDIFKAQDEFRANCADKAKGKLYTRLKDALLTLLSSRISTDIKTAHGKEMLKLEIFDLLTPIVFPDSSKGVITNVYFETFMVQ